MTGANRTNDDTALQDRGSGTVRASSGANDTSSPGPENLPLAHRVVDLRRQELALLERQAQVHEAGIAAARNQEDHQFQFTQQRLALLAASQSHLFKVTWVTVGLFGIVVVGLLGMAFFGTGEQRQVAVALGRDGLLLAAGYGLFSALGRLLKRSADKQ